MYLHIGNGETVQKSRIIGIFDLDTATVSQTTRHFLAKEEKEGHILPGGEDLPKCFLLLANPKERQTKKREQAYVRLLRISSASLRMRAEQPFFTDGEDSENG